MIDRLLIMTVSGLTIVGSALGWVTDDARRTSTDRMEQPVLPAYVTPSNEIVVHRGSDALFHIPVSIDNFNRTMIIDTGASRTTISSSLAIKMGYPMSTWDGQGQVRTLGGITSTFSTDVQTLKIGTITLRNFAVSVVQNDEDIAVLGQDVLSKLDKITIERDTIRLR